MSVPFRLTIPNKEIARLRRWGDWCRYQGVRSEFIAALKELNRRLLWEPLDDWSEPYQDVLTLKLQMRSGAVDMIGVNYGVHENQQDVLVKQFKWIGKVKPPDSV